MTGTAGACTNEAQLRLRARVVDQVGDGAAVVDNDGWFVLVNPASRRCTAAPART